MMNPYAPSEATSAPKGLSQSRLLIKRRPVKRRPMMIALMLIALTSLLTGAAVGLLCAQAKGVGQDETKQIISFFMLFATAFALMGMYLGNRSLSGGMSLGYIFTVFGSFAVAFALTSTPNYRTVTLWIAGLAACCAVSTTAIAAAARAIAYSNNHGDEEERLI